MFSGVAIITFLSVFLHFLIGSPLSGASMPRAALCIRDARIV